MPITSELLVSLSRWAIPFLLVVFRLAGLFITAPMLSSTMILPRYKALLALMLGAAVFPMVPGEELGASVVTDTVGLIPLLFWEAAIGFVLGMMLSIPLLALEASGALCGHQMGISLGRVYNPGSDEDADVLGQMFYFCGLAVFFASGGMDRAAGALIDSFRHVPIGSLRAEGIPSKVLVGMIASGVELSLRISSPVTAIVLLLSVTFGAIGKTMPQINIMSVGFSAKAVAGLLMLFFSAYAANEASSDEIFMAVNAAVDWLGGLGRVK